MDVLNVELSEVEAAAAAAASSADGASETHGMVDVSSIQQHHQQLLNNAAVSIGDDPTSIMDVSPRDLANGSPTPSTSSARSKRKNIGKMLQLTLIRKYVACARHMNRIPDRLTTEHLLEEAYEEYFFDEGALNNEPRLSYTAFLKLLRNRRSELLRQDRVNQQLAPHGKTPRRHLQKDQQEIRQLIEELEQVRQLQSRSSSASDMSDYESLDAMNQLMLRTGDPLALPASVASLATTGTTPSEVEESEDSMVLVSREKLDLLLQLAQQTLQSQKAIFDQVHAIEQRLSMQ